MSRMVSFKICIRSRSFQTNLISTLTDSFDLLSSFFFRERRVYHLTSSSEYKISWSEIIEIGRKVIETKMPLNNVVWYPGGSLKTSKFLHNVCFYLFHIIPAILVDLLLVALGYKPM